MSIIGQTEPNRCDVRWNLRLQTHLRFAIITTQQIVDLNHIVDDCRYFIEIRAQHHATAVEYRLSPVPVYVACDMALTGQVVMNLCSNAIDETAEWPERASR